MKKGITLSLTALISLSAIATTLLMNSKIISSKVLASPFVTQAQYTLSNFEFKRHTGLIYSYGDFYNGFVFNPTSGRSDIEVVVLIRADSMNLIIEEELVYGVDGTCYQLTSNRIFYDYYNEIDMHYEYAYEDNKGEDGGLAFIVADLTCFACTDFTIVGEDFSYNPLENFTDYSITVGSSFAYNYMSAPGASHEVDTYQIFDNYVASLYRPHQLIAALMD